MNMKEALEELKRLKAKRAEEWNKMKDEDGECQPLTDEEWKKTQATKIKKGKKPCYSNNKRWIYTNEGINTKKRK